MKIQEYKKIKKGQKIELTFDSSIKKGNKIEFIASGKFRNIKSSWAESRIILKKEGGNFKCYLYLSKNGVISLAIGNMATSNLKIN